MSNLFKDNNKDTRTTLMTPNKYMPANTEQKSNKYHLPESRLA